MNETTARQDLKLKMINVYCVVQLDNVIKYLQGEP